MEPTDYDLGLDDFDNERVCYVGDTWTDDPSAEWGIDICEGPFTIADAHNAVAKLARSLKAGRTLEIHEDVSRARTAQYNEARANAHNRLCDCGE